MLTSFDIIAFLHSYVLFFRNEDLVIQAWWLVIYWFMIFRGNTHTFVLEMIYYRLTVWGEHLPFF